MHAWFMLPKVSLLVTFIVAVVSPSANADEGAEWLRRLRSHEHAVRWLAAYDTAAVAGAPAARLSWMSGMSDTSDFVRAHTYSMLGELGDASSSSIASLVSALYKEVDGAPATAAAVALGKLGADAIPALVDVLRQGPAASAAKGIEIRSMHDTSCANGMFMPSFSAAIALGQIGPAAVQPMLRLMPGDEKRWGKAAQCYFHEGSAVQPYIVLAIRSIGPAAFPALIAEIESASGHYRERLIGVLKKAFWQSNHEGLAAYERLMRHDDTREYAIRQLEALGTDEARAIVSRFPAPPPDGMDELRARLRAAKAPTPRLKGIAARLDAVRAARVLTPEMEAIALGVEADLPPGSELRVDRLRVFESHRKQLWSFSDRTLMVLISGAVDSDRQVSEIAWGTLVNQGRLPQRLVPQAAALLQPALEGSPESRARAFLIMAELHISTPKVRQRIIDIFQNAAAVKEVAAVGGRRDPLEAMLQLLASEPGERDSIDGLQALLRHPPKGLKSSDVASAIAQAGPSAAHLAPAVTAAYLNSADRREAESIALALARLGLHGRQVLQERCRGQHDLTACHGVASCMDDSSLSVLLQVLASGLNREEKENRSLAEGLLHAIAPKVWRGNTDAPVGGVPLNFTSHHAEIEAALPVLRQLLGSRDESTRALAVELAAALQGPARQLIPDIVAAIASRALDGYLPRELLAPIQSLGKPASLALAERARAGSMSPDALKLLSQLALPPDEVAAALLPSLKAEDSQTRGVALEIMAGIDAPAHLRSAALRDGLGDSVAGIRVLAAERAMHDPDLRALASAVLVPMLYSPDDSLRHRAVASLMSSSSLDADTRAILAAVAIDDYLAHWWKVTSERFYDEFFKTAVSARGPTLPEFPWPAPRFSEREVIPRHFIGTDDMSLLQVDVRLSGALHAAGFRSGGVFRIAGGYVRVTRLEQTQSDGTPLAGDDRWTADAVPARDLADFLGKLFLQSRGYFRFFVFAVTDQYKLDNGKTLSMGDATDYFRRGHPLLPEEYNRVLFGGKECYVLIYNFERTDRVIRLVVPGTIDASTQLKRSGLWDALVHINRP